MSSKHSAFVLFLPPRKKKKKKKTFDFIQIQKVCLRVILKQKNNVDI